MINKSKKPTTTLSPEKDCTYGGYRYRLEYDKFEDKGEKNRFQTRNKRKKAIILFICAAILIVFGLLIWRYVSSVEIYFNNWV